MVKDAEAHAAEDKKRRDVIEQRNRLDNMVYQSRRSPGVGRQARGGPQVPARCGDSVGAVGSAQRQRRRDQQGARELQQAYSAAGASLYAARGA